MSRGSIRPTDAVAPVEIYGDSSYGTAEFVEAIEGAGAEANVRVQPPSAPKANSPRTLSRST